MIKLLQTAYPSHYGAKWKDVYSVRFEHTYLASFAIKDNKPTIIQDEENSAVSLYVNPEGKNITIECACEPDLLFHHAGTLFLPPMKKALL